MRADAEAAAEALKERLEKLLDSSREVHHHRSEVAEVRTGRCFQVDTLSLDTQPITSSAVHDL